MAKITIAQLAREAGVSIATVDRVLNGRERVRETTAMKVQQAAERIGYHGVNAIRERIWADLPELRVGIILQKERHAFYRDFAEEIVKAMNATTSRRLRVSIKFAETTMPGELADLLKSMLGRVDAVAATGLDHPEVTHLVEDLRARGIPTFSLLSDFAQGVRESYIGLNNLRVGRTVGWLMSKLTADAGKVGIFVGGNRFHGHALRETGFRSSMREYAPELELLNPQINLETPNLTYEATIAMLEDHDDLTGIYCAGGGMEGAIAALRETGRARRTALIVHELTEETRDALEDRTVSIVLSTPLRDLCEELTAMIVHTVEHGMAETPGQRFLPHGIWTPESF